MSVIYTLHSARNARSVKLQVRNSAFLADLAISTFTNSKRWLIVKLQSMFFMHISACRFRYQHYKHVLHVDLDINTQGCRNDRRAGGAAFSKGTFNILRTVITTNIADILSNN